MPFGDPYSEGSAGKEVLASPSLQPGLNRGTLTAQHRRSCQHWIGKAPKVRWKNKFLLPGTVVLVIYAVMGQWFHVPFIFFTSPTKPAARQCPSYTEYSKHSQSPHGTPSDGPLGLPYMRPDLACRTFTSVAVEDVIRELGGRMKDPDLARLFENTFPNTLDTTVKYFDKTENVAFIVTGVRWAQWLRDTANQFAHYFPLLSKDANLAALVRAVINTESRYVAEYPYCGAFQPPPESRLEPTENDWATGVIVNPPVDNETVFECKYEIDSLWHSAINQIIRVIEEQSQASWDEDFNFVSYYNWTGTPGASLSPLVNNDGNGEPKGYTGMVGTHHRPSDDLTTFAFLTPANAMLSVELGFLAEIMDAAGQNSLVASSARTWSKRIRDALWDTTIEDGVFAYETNGLGSKYFMDDANVPSLLSLPYLGFLDRNNPTYKSSREYLLSARNPYYVEGNVFKGIGGPHARAWRPWPMSLVSSIFGSDDDTEILNALYTIANNTAGLGLIHEAQHIHNSSDYTRPWFAWANSYFAEMILDLAARKPHLILKANESYHV
ncbi:Six-hairpin glycosidase-like protein [Thelephora terrestris]|uniref:Six-hairpin glycosidase-like protein n=1 Tax=Thelephora terrestris TaxID=56493 RepID=A0A9P6HAI7_9AGAM|nr:Six-hairpin glycosidase-like protein [Thelephora terrestris]